MVERPSSTKNKKSFIHIRDEGLPPRYHPDSVEGLQVKSYRLSLNFEPSNIQTLSRAITGFPGDGYSAASLRSPAQSLFRANRRVRSYAALPMGTALGSHLSFPTR